MSKIAVIPAVSLMCMAFIACGGDDRPSLGTIHGGAGGVSGDVVPVGGAIGLGPCKEGMSRACSIELGSYKGLPADCFKGVSLCVDGHWTRCLDPGSKAVAHLFESSPTDAGVSEDAGTGAGDSADGGSGS